MSKHAVFVVVVYHVTIVVSGHGLSKKFGPMVIGSVLRTPGSFLHLKLCGPAYLIIEFIHIK